MVKNILSLIIWKNKKKVIFYLTFVLLIISCTEKEERLDGFIFNRHVEMEGQTNFRDLGNYLTVDGKRIKDGVIFRSGTLSKLTASDIDKLKNMGIKTVVNFLTDEEITNRGKDRLPEDVKTISLPISGDNSEASIVLKARNTGDFTKVPLSLNYDIHEILPEVGSKAYSEFLRVLSDSTNYPLVFHCSHGVHRTGTATALLLSLLNVPWAQIESDYLLSNKYRKEENEKRITQLDSIARTNIATLDYEKNRNNIEAFYLLKSDYINGTKRKILDKYGSFENYFKKNGLTDKDIDNIKYNLLNNQKEYNK